MHRTHLKKRDRVWRFVGFTLNHRDSVITTDPIMCTEIICDVVCWCVVGFAFVHIVEPQATKQTLCVSLRRISLASKWATHYLREWREIDSPKIHVDRLYLPKDLTSILHKTRNRCKTCSLKKAFLSRSWLTTPPATRHFLVATLCTLVADNDQERLYRLVDSFSIRN